MSLLTATRWLARLAKPGRMPTAADDAQFRAAATARGLTAWAHGGLLLAMDRAAPDASQWRAFLPFPGRLQGTRRLPRGDTLAALAADADAHFEIYDALAWDGTTLELLSDPVGLKPLYCAELDDCWLFATRLLDLFRLTPALVTPLDPLGLHQHVVARAPLGERTLHARVRRTPPGAHYTWSAAGGLACDQSRRWRHPDADPAMTPGRLIPLLRERLAADVAALRAMSDAPWWVAMSGGYDSRLIAAMAVRTGIAMTAATYGDAHHPEVWMAREVARVLDLPFRIRTYPRDLVLDRARESVVLLDGQTDLSIAQAHALFQTGLTAATPLLHGIAGDNPSGSFQDRPGRAAYVSHDALAEGIWRHYAHSPVDIRAALGTGAAEADSIAQIRADIDDRQTTTQAMALWGWENHFRKYTNGILVVLGEAADVMVPFYDKTYNDLWALAPLDGLLDRAWLKQWFIDDFPAMARIPHEKKMKPLLPNPGLMARIWLRQSRDRIESRLYGHAGLKQRQIDAERHPYIYNLPNLASARHRELMHNACTRLRNHARDRLGLDLSPAAWDALGGLALPPPQGQRIAWALGVYAEAIDTALAS